MIGLLKKIVGLCDHKWVPSFKYDIVSTADSKTIGTCIVTKCEKCGSLKKWEFK